MTTPRTRVTARGELLRERPATKMPGYIALEVVRQGHPNELWHVVPEVEVEARVIEWARARDIYVQSIVLIRRDKQ